MTTFLKLTNQIINTSDIHRILIQPNKYYIEINRDLSDIYFGLLFGSGFGNLVSKYTKIEICKYTDPYDYNIVYDWINRID